MRSLYLIPERYLRAAALTVMGVVLATPLFTFAEFYFPFIAPRNFIFRISVSVLLVVYALLVAQNRQYLPRKNVLLALLAAFVVMMTIASLQGNDLAYSFWSNFERMEGLITFYHLFAFIIMSVCILRTEQQWESVLGISLILAFVVAMVGFSQFRQVNILLASSGGERISSTIGNATYLAAYLLLHLFFAAYFLSKPIAAVQTKVFRYGFIFFDAILLLLQIMAVLRDKTGILNQIFSDWMLGLVFIIAHGAVYASFMPRENRFGRLSLKFFVGLSALLFLFIISITQTRGALVGLAAALIFSYIAIMLRKEQARVKMAATAVLGVCVLSVILVFINKDSTFVRETPILNKIATISLTDRTTLTRVETWKAALKGVSDPRHLILGWGVENFHVVFNKFFPPAIYTDEGTPLWFDRPHNLLIQYLVEGGIVGVGLYLAFIIAVIWHVLRRRENRFAGIIVSAGVVAYVVQSLFVFDSINSYVPLYLLLGFSIFLASREQAVSEEHQQVLPPSTGMALIAISVVVGVVSIMYLTMPPLNANHEFVKYYKQLSQEVSDNSYDPATVNAIFAVIDGAPYLGRNELLGVTSEFTVGLIQEKRLPESDTYEIVDGLVERFDRLRAIKSDDARFNLFEMNLLLNAGNLDPRYLDKVITLGKDTLPLSPSRPHIYYLVGRALMAQGKYDEGTEYFKQAVALAPDVFDSHWNLFAAYLTIGDSGRARQELSELLRVQQPTIQFYSRIVSLMAARYEYELAIETLNKALLEFKDSTELYVGLAEVYAAMGDNAKAREAALRAVELNPAIKAEADDFLKQLETGVFRRPRPAAAGDLQP